jgi:hypothetical protein
MTEPKLTAADVRKGWDDLLAEALASTPAQLRTVEEDVWARLDRTHAAMLAQAASHDDENDDESVHSRPSLTLIYGGGEGA